MALLNSLPEPVSKFLAGDIRVLSYFLNMAENGDERLLEYMPYLLPHSGRSYVVGITGPPGAGKSTLIDGLAAALAEEGKEVGIICIDPTSPFTGGAFLGDRIRMQRAAKLKNVFIRSMATRNSYGGLAPGLWEAIELLDSFGKEVVIVETVGVGQLEVDIHELADVTVVVTVPGLGDDIQTLKAGLMEAADIFVVNMADKPGAADKIRSLKHFLEQLRGSRGVEEAFVIPTVAIENKGINELKQVLQRFRERLVATGEWQQRKKQHFRAQVKRRVLEVFRDYLEKRLEEEDELRELLGKVERRECSVSLAVSKIISYLLTTLRN